MKGYVVAVSQKEADEIARDLPDLNPRPAAHGGFYGLEFCSSPEQDRRERLEERDAFQKGRWPTGSLPEPPD